MCFDTVVKKLSNVLRAAVLPRYQIDIDVEKRLVAQYLGTILYTDVHSNPNNQLGLIELSINVDQTLVHTRVICCKLFLHKQYKMETLRL